MKRMWRLHERRKPVTLYIDAWRLVGQKMKEDLLLARYRLADDAVRLVDVSPLV